jgi:predicted TIM-barrel fold metal-dependent hydrolase
LTRQRLGFVGIGQADRRKLLHDNARRIYRIETRERLEHA